MGICSSKDGLQDEKKLSPEEKDKLASARNQRRRLSVTPEHVGDVHGDDKTNKARKQSLSHAPETQARHNKKPEQQSINESKEDRLRNVAITKKGYVPYNRNKKNQDAYLLREGLQNDEEMHMFGVCDGHGEFGHKVAQHVQAALPDFLEQQNDLKTDTEQAVKRCVKLTADSLAESGINCAFSGTTLVFAVQNGDTFHSANLGDSRAVMCRDPNNQFAKNSDLSIGFGVEKTPQGVFAVGLSRDQKPEDVGEKKRSLAAGGRVEPLPGPPDEDCGPPRVWLKEVDVPGLAMSRSLGDDVAHTVGVSNLPEVISYKLDPADKFCVWASDGVWEFMSNTDVVDLVNSRLPDLKQAAKDLVQESVKRWRQEEEVVDDITAVIVRFNMDKFDE